MPRRAQKSKPEKLLLGVRRVVATNIQNLLDRDFPGEQRGQHGRFREKFPKVHLSKIQRAVQEGALNIASIEQFAEVFKVEPYQLFIDGLDVERPQVAADPDAVRAVETIQQLGEKRSETQRERKAGRRDDAQTRHPPA